MGRLSTPERLSGGQRSRWLYYLYKSTKAVEFYRPVMYLFFLAQDLSFTQIALLEIIYSVTTVLGEIPTGYLGDSIGRRNSLLVGTLLITVTLVGIGLAGSFATLAVLYVLWSMGYNFRSGSEDAWLYDTLVDDQSTPRFAAVRGRGESAALAIGALAAVLGGLLGGIDLRLPWFVAAGVTSLGVPVLLLIDDPAGTGYPADDRFGIAQALGVIRTAFDHPRVRALMGYYFVLYAAVTYLVFVYLQPVFETVVVGLGFSGRIEPLLGVFYAAYSLVGAGLTYHTGWIRRVVGMRTWFLTLPFVVGAALMAMAFLPLLALPTFLFARGLADVTRTFAVERLNDRIASTGRATVLSAMAMVSGLTVVPFQLGAGVLSDAVSPLIALAVAGGVLVVGSALVFRFGAPLVD